MLPLNHIQFSIKRVSPADGNATIRSRVFESLWTQMVVLGLCATNVIFQFQPDGEEQN